MDDLLALDRAQTRLKQARNSRSLTGFKPVVRPKQAALKGDSDRLGLLSLERELSGQAPQSRLQSLYTSCRPAVRAMAVDNDEPIVLEQGPEAGRFPVQGQHSLVEDVSSVQVETFDSIEADEAAAVPQDEEAPRESAAFSSKESLPLAEEIIVDPFPETPSEQAAEPVSRESSEDETAPGIAKSPDPLTVSCQGRGRRLSRQRRQQQMRMRQRPRRRMMNPSMSA